MRVKGAKRVVVLEALLSYLLSWFMLSSNLEDGLNSYIFPLAILLAKGKMLALGLFT